MAASDQGGGAKGAGRKPSADSGCPICGRPVPRRGASAPAAEATTAAGPRGAPDPFPFCSPRCQLIDLGRWLGEEYRVADRDTVVWPPPDDEGS